MSKYIDAEELKVELDRQKVGYNIDGKHNAEYDTCVKVLRIINTLQQEQGLIVINKKDWEAQEQFRKNKDFGKPLQQEHQTSDLDADIEMEWDSFSKHLAKYGEESEDVVWINRYNFNELARHFYELGLKVRKEE